LPTAQSVSLAIHASANYAECSSPTDQTSHHPHYFLSSSAKALKRGLTPIGSGQS
jgi:hypothetical protein